MRTSRLESFSDGFLSICITIMVLELEAPRGTQLEELRALVPGILSYVLSFITIGTYWNNHHHLVHAVRSVDGRALWANLHLLFWLSLISFSTRWMVLTRFTSLSVAAYGLVLFMAAVAFVILARCLAAPRDGSAANPRRPAGGAKEYLTLGLYAAALALAFVLPPLSLGIYALVTVLWIIPGTGGGRPESGAD